MLSVLAVLAAALLMLSPRCGASARRRHAHHHADCLDHVWRSKLSKHAELVAARASMLAISAADFYNAKNAYDPYEPTYTCHSEWRTGGLFGDGGKFVCGERDYLRHRGCVAYSVGSNGDTKFEADVIKRFGCEVHTFDPTGNTTLFHDLVVKTGAAFHAWGVGTTGTKLHTQPIHRDQQRTGGTARHHATPGPRARRHSQN